MEPEHSKFRSNSSSPTKTGGNSQLQAITNRVNYILRKHKKAKINFNSTKIQATTIATDGNKIIKNNYMGTQEPLVQSITSATIHKNRDTNQQSKDFNLDDSNKIKCSVSLAKLTRCRQRREEFSINHVILYLCSLETYKVAEITVILLQASQAAQSYQVRQDSQGKPEPILVDQDEIVRNSKINKETTPSDHGCQNGRIKNQDLKRGGRFTQPILRTNLPPITTGYKNQI